MRVLEKSTQVKLLLLAYSPFHLSQRPRVPFSFDVQFYEDGRRKQSLLRPCLESFYPAEENWHGMVLWSRPPDDTIFCDFMISKFIK